MFETFFEQWKKENIEFFKERMNRLEEMYDKFCIDLMADLTTRKAKTEEELKEKDKELKEKQSKANALADEIVKLEEGKKVEQKKLNEILVKQEQSASQLIEQEKKIEKIVEREKAVESEEKELKEKKIGLTAKEMEIEEKGRSIRRALEKYNE